MAPLDRGARGPPGVDARADRHVNKSECAPNRFRATKAHTNRKGRFVLGARPEEPVGRDRDSADQTVILKEAKQWLFVHGWRPLIRHLFVESRVTQTVEKYFEPVIDVPSLDDRAGAFAPQH